jgi:hypothetical protein
MSFLFIIRVFLYGAIFLSAMYILVNLFKGHTFPQSWEELTTPTIEAAFIWLNIGAVIRSTQLILLNFAFHFEWSNSQSIFDWGMVGVTAQAIGFIIAAYIIRKRE